METKTLPFSKIPPEIWKKVKPEISKRYVKEVEKFYTEYGEAYFRKHCNDNDDFYGFNQCNHRLSLVIYDLLYESYPLKFNKKTVYGVATMSESGKLFGVNFEDLQYQILGDLFKMIDFLYTKPEFLQFYDYAYELAKCTIGANVLMNYSNLFVPAPFPKNGLEGAKILSRKLEDSYGALIGTCQIAIRLDCYFFIMTYYIFVYHLLSIFKNLLGIYSQILSLNLWMMKTAVMIIANNGFQDHEFSATYEALLEANAQVTIAAGRKGQCVGVFGQKIEAAYELSEIKGDKFEMVIFIGGGGCLTQYLHNSDYLRIAQEAKKLGAICIAPMVVSESGVFNGKIVTSRDDEGLQQNFIENYGGVWKDETVIRYGNIVTANGPEAAEAFGKECVKLLEDDAI